ncbi:S8 family serine peptidase [Actinosynnema mirum]|uniref:Peptidase S8 and S53 subtilisin kexin sedolisin n=1 Tax=Actinosynnema mirum (strain ATCC 29888 / DSM 43827 / JCM 3225 / NBRC 14064 / NCIMB 13271 / NRRL B-12336 / IMRU 3971 / 101) TaxID=446462 RepID=C6WHD0_ACTMD|nr:S8 family serine peptidase [Actinosynnema mirum]ACU38049.1 peptidase S8 and S53 subtilisin kexin sedolisin [Actinosynnema mirum DSM 43827]
MPLRKQLSTGVVAVVAAAALTATTAAAEPAGPDPERQGAAGPAVRGTVTLLTGDTVTVRGDDVQVKPGAGREKIAFQRSADRDGLHVVPSDVVADVASGRLDRRLFDVAGLIAQGYDDARTDHLPLIVTGAPGAARVAGDGVRELPSVDGYALKAPKSRPVLAAGVESAGGRIWLDGKVSATLDRSTAQIGAPAAWAAGLTGAGAKVAVLDTGVDATHPDLAGAVAESADFTDAADADDHLGHGTHVAATVTGAGKYRGVAPDAEVLNGKVLDDTGGGYDSWIIAGMEWAAARADVVSMSLGGPATDGADPMSLAVDRLTAETGALFVIAAGNSGGASTVGSPGSAASALTVGAVDRDDSLAPFSSRGPRTGDYAIKPEITAPGVNIVAAKAKNGVIGTPVDDAHVAMSGTSMAAPHVAGAAAILAQQHPDWRAPQLKAALMGAAVDPKGATVYEQGAGRVDLARATTIPVQADPAALDLDTLRFPHDDGEQPSPRTVTYRNTGDQPVELALSGVLRDPSGAEIPGAVSMSPSSVTVPAGGSAEVVVTTTLPADSPIGAYSGVLLAGDAVRVPIGLTRERESYDVTVTATDHAGAPASDYGYALLNLETGERFGRFDPSGRVTVRVPRGRYAVQGMVYSGERATLFVEPAFEVGGPSALELDARRGRQLKPKVEARGAQVGYVQALTLIPLGDSWVSAGGSAGSAEALLLAPSRTRDEDANTALHATLAKADGAGRFTGSPYQYRLAWENAGGIPEDVGRVRAVRDRELGRVDATAAAVADGSWVVYPENAVVAAPSTTRLHYTPGVEWSQSAFLLDSPDARANRAYQGRGMPKALRAGEVVRESWYRGVLGPAFPLTPGGALFSAGRTDDTVIYFPDLFSDQDPNHYGGRFDVTGKIALSRDGQPVAEAPVSDYLIADVPAEAGAYVLEANATGGGYAVSTEVSARWSFRSEHAQEPAFLPLLAVRFAPDVDERNRASRGRSTIPVSVQRNGSAEASDVRRPSVEVSYDDGRTWRAAPVSGRNGKWSVTTVSPAGATHASLRASTSDSSGNSVQQTVIRAYALR